MMHIIDDSGEGDENSQTEEHHLSKLREKTEFSLRPESVHK